MSSLKKTNKFAVWEVPTGVEGHLQSSERLSSRSVAVCGGKKSSVIDLINVAEYNYSVSLDFTGLEYQPPADTTIVTDYTPSPTVSMMSYPSKFWRAILFARIVSLMQGRSQVRFEIIQALADVLNFNIVPIKEDISFANQIIVDSICCPPNSTFLSKSGVIPLSQALATAGIRPQQILKSELSTLLSGTCVPTGISCLLVGGALNIATITEGISALSCEAFGAMIDPFDGDQFDSFRQHRGQITSSANLRSLLEGSKRVNKPVLNAPLSEVFLTLPQRTGPALDVINSAVKVLEIELNTSEGGALCEDRVGFNPTQSLLSLDSVAASLTSLMSSSLLRIGALSTGQVSATAVKELATLGNDQQDVFLNTLNILASAIEALGVEALVSLKAVGLPAANEVATATADVTSGGGKKLPDSKKPELDESHLTPEQRAKAEAKRQEKAKKAAEKAALKGAKKVAGTGGGALGAGTELIRAALVSRLGLSDGSSLDSMSPSEVVAVLNPFDVSEQGFASVCRSILEKLNSGGKRKPKIAKGARDYGPEPMRIREQVFSAIRRVFKRHGGVEIDTPVFELKEVLTGKYGEDTKLIYDLADQGGELLALRYDLTVPFARFLAMNSVGNIKRYHIAKVYRRDQPQLARGRYREFYQCDFDVAGAYSPMVPDAEVITVAAEILTDLPVGPFLIKLNHRKLLDAIFEICGVPVEKFRPICSAVDKLDKAPWSEVHKEMVEEKGLSPAVADRIGEFVLNCGEPKTLWEQLSSTSKFGNHTGAAAAMQDLQLLFEYLDAMGSLQFVSFDLSLARGLDYYTGVIYEVVLVDGLSQVGSIAAGGRYDNLVGMFSTSGTQTPCVGVSIGVERVFTIMEKKARDLNLMQAANVQVYIASIGKGLIPQRMRFAQMLWRANISAEFPHQDNPAFKKQLEECLDRKIPFMVVFGSSELKENKVKIKDTRLSTEEDVSIDDLVSALLAKGCQVIPPGSDTGLLQALHGSTTATTVTNEA